MINYDPTEWATGGLTFAAHDIGSGFIGAIIRFAAAEICGGHGNTEPLACDVQVTGELRSIQHEETRTLLAIKTGTDVGHWFTVYPETRVTTLARVTTTVGPAPEPVPEDAFDSDSASLIADLPTATEETPEDPTKCPASTETAGMTVGCALSAGHEGPHVVEIDSTRDDLPPVVRAILAGITEAIEQHAEPADDEEGDDE